MKIQFKQLVFVTAFATAITANAQSPEPSSGTVPVVPDPNPAIMPSGGTNAPSSQAPATQQAPAAQQAPATQQDRAQGNRQSDAVKRSDPIRACADLPEGEVAACLEREDAAKTRAKGAANGKTSSNGTKASSGDAAIRK